MEDYKGFELVETKKKGDDNSDGISPNESYGEKWYDVRPSKKSLEKTVKKLDKILRKNKKKRKKDKKAIVSQKKEIAALRKKLSSKKEKIKQMEQQMNYIKTNLFWCMVNQNNHSFRNGAFRASDALEELPPYQSEISL